MKEIFPKPLVNLLVKKSRVNYQKPWLSPIVEGDKHRDSVLRIAGDLNKNPNNCCCYNPNQESRRRTLRRWRTHRLRNRSY